MNPQLLSNRALSILRKSWLVALFFCSIFWLCDGQTTVLAQTEPTMPLMQNMERLWHWGGAISTMTPVSDTLYVGMGQGLAIFDIAEPASPKLLGQLSLNAPLYDIEIVGAHALIAAWGKGLLIVDVSDKHAPRLVAKRLASYTVNSIAVAAPYAYVAYGSGIEILDVTHPEAPIVVNAQMAGLEDFDPATLQITANHLFVAGGKFVPDRYTYHTWGEIQAFDLADPTAPTPLPAYRTEVAIGSDKRFDDLRLQGDDAYAVRSDGIARFAISTPTTITLSSQINLASLDPSSLTVIGAQLYIAKRTWLQNDADGLYILDALSSSTITVGSFLPQLVNAIAIQGNYAFVGRDDDGLHVWDVTKPLTPREIGNYRNFVSVGGGDLIAHEPFLHATGGRFGTPLLSAIDLRKPSEPTLTTVITGSDSTAFYPFIDGNWLLLAAVSPRGSKFDHVQIFDIANPGAPQRVARYETQPFTSAAYANHRLYLETLEQLPPSAQIRVFNFVTPTTPIFTKAIYTAPQVIFVNFHDFSLNEHYLYYIGSDSSKYPTLTQPYYLYVYDLANDQRIASIEIPWTYSVYLYGDTLYGIALTTKGGCSSTIYTVDVAEPAAPRIRQTYCWPKLITDLLVDGNLLYIADRSQDYYSDRNQGGLSVLDFTLPHAPSLAGYAVEISVEPQIAKMNDTIYFLGDGLSAYRYTPPQATTRLGQGGHLAADFDKVAYTFPAATFVVPVTVTHTTHFANPWLAFPAPQFGVGHAFSLESTAVDTGEAVQPTGAFSLTLAYTDEEVQSVDETTLTLYRWVGGVWVVEEGSMVDPATNTVVASPNANGVWMLGAVARNRIYFSLIYNIQP